MKQGPDQSALPFKYPWSSKHYVSLLHLQLPRTKIVSCKDWKKNWRVSYRRIWRREVFLRWEFMVHIYMYLYYEKISITTFFKVFTTLKQCINMLSKSFATDPLGFRQLLSMHSAFVKGKQKSWVERINWNKCLVEGCIPDARFQNPHLPIKSLVNESLLYLC